MGKKTTKPKIITAQSLAERLFQAPFVHVTPLQETAVNLHQLGFNVFPLPYGKKGGYPWGMMQYARLHLNDLLPIFRDRANIAIMTGRTSGNLFVIDCETAAAFEQHKQLLREAKIPIWSVATSGPKGGGHIYLRCKDGEVKNIKSGQRPDYEVRGNRCYVLAPPSLHPTSGRLYDWDIRQTLEPPTVTLDQLPWLELTLNRESRKEKRTIQPFPELSNTSRDFIFHGAPFGERNNRLFSAACDMAGNNYTLYTAEQILLPVAAKIGTPETEARATIASAFSRPRTPAKPQFPKERLIPAWALAAEWAHEQTWHNRKGQTDRAVFLACCERAKTANAKGVFRASSREIAELARVRRSTATASLKRLVEAKLLVSCGTDRQSKANLFHLGPSTQKPTGKNSRYWATTAYASDGQGSVPVAGISVLPTTAGSDLAERGALGKTAYNLYQAMLAHPQPGRAKQLAQIAHLSVKQVYRALDNLRAFQMVEKVSGGYQAVQMTGEQLDRLAQSLGVSSKPVQRRERHERERAGVLVGRFYVARWGKGYKLEKPRKQRKSNESGQLSKSEIVAQSYDQSGELKPSPQMLTEPDRSVELEPVHPPDQSGELKPSPQMLTEPDRSVELEPVHPPDPSGELKPPDPLTDPTETSQPPAALDNSGQSKSLRPSRAPSRSRRSKKLPAAHDHDHDSPSPTRFVCMNCGQIWDMPGVDPPFTCDFCRDATTWQPLV